MEEVAPLMTAEERQKFHAVEEGDRDLFKELFWARRDPTPANRRNEAKDSFEQWQNRAAEQLEELDPLGSSPDMALATLLLGPPDTPRHTAPPGDRQSRDRRSPAGALVGDPIREDRSLGARATGIEQPSADGLRATWSPDPEAGLPDGLEITFHATEFGVWMVRSGKIDAALDRARRRRIAYPSIDYALTDDGRLRRLEDRFDPNSPAKQILHALRDGGETSDAIGLTPTLWFFRANSDHTNVTALVEVDGDRQIQWQWQRGGYSAPVQAFYSVEDALGTVVGHDEAEIELLRVHPVFEMPIRTPPGRYTVRLGVRDPATDLLGTTSLEVDVPDFSRESLSLSSIARVRGASPDSDRSPAMGRALVVGGTHFETRVSSVYYPGGQFLIVFAAYGYGVGDDGQPNLKSQITFTKGGEPDEPYVRYESELVLVSTDLAIGIPELFLVDPYDSWRPSFDHGAYCVEITVNDLVSGQSVTDTMPFSVEVDPDRPLLASREALGGCDR